MESGVTALAPATVASGANFVVELTADAVNVPTEGGGYPIKRLTDLKVRFQLPAGTSFVSATLSGGSNLGSGTRTVTASGNVVTLTVPGPLAPGTTAVLPKVTTTLKATGAAGTVLQARLAGSSYANPSITFNAVVSAIFGIEVTAATNCYAPTNPVIATTTII
jgi:dehydratase